MLVTVVPMPPPAGAGHHDDAAVEAQQIRHNLLSSAALLSGQESDACTRLENIDSAAVIATSRAFLKSMRRYCLDQRLVATVRRRDTSLQDSRASPSPIRPPSRRGVARI